MNNIRIIEPTVINATPLLRVAVYCRISTEREEQECSLKAQIDHFTYRIHETPEWEFAGIYAEQESGVNTNRSELMRLLHDCEAGQIDLALLKSTSRLSRNTLDALTIFNHLLGKGIELRFEVENLSTKDKRIRQMFAMLAAMAQEESWSKSENIKWACGIRRTKGTPSLITVNFSGIQKILPDNWSSLKMKPRLSGLFIPCIFRVWTVEN